MSAVDNKARIEAYFAKLKGKLTVEAPQIIAETAAEFFKDNILQGVDINGVTFIPLSEDYLAHKSRNQDKILYYKGFMFASIRPSDVSASRVVISAGSSMVPYARIHNEGLTVNTTAHVQAYKRNTYKYSKKGKRGKAIASSQVRAHTRQMHYTMPKRQFMGYSAPLYNKIKSRMSALIKAK